MTQIQKLAAAINERGDRFLAMCREDPEHEGSQEGFTVCGEQDGLYRALALTPALTFADWHVKEAVFRERCCGLRNSARFDDSGGGRGGEGYSDNIAEFLDEIPARLAASLLDDINALLKPEVAIAA